MGKWIIPRQILLSGDANFYIFPQGQHGENVGRPSRRSVEREGGRAGILSFPKSFGRKSSAHLVDKPSFWMPEYYLGHDEFASFAVVYVTSELTIPPRLPRALLGREPLFRHFRSLLV
jgi:hypothetical protein